MKYISQKIEYLNYINHIPTSIKLLSSYRKLCCLKNSGLKRNEINIQKYKTFHFVTQIILVNKTVESSNL